MSKLVQNILQTFLKNYSLIFFLNLVLLNDVFNIVYFQCYADRFNEMW